MAQLNAAYNKVGFTFALTKVTGYLLGNLSAWQPDATTELQRDCLHRRRGARMLLGLAQLWDLSKVSGHPFYGYTRSGSRNEQWMRTICSCGMSMLL